MVLLTILYSVKADGLLQRCSHSSLFAFPLTGQHLLGVQQQQAPGSETKVDPLFSASHSPPPQEVHCQKAKSDII